MSSAVPAGSAVEVHVSGVPADAAAKLLARVQAFAQVRFREQCAVLTCVMACSAVEVHVSGVPAEAAAKLLARVQAFAQVGLNLQ